MEKDKVAIYVRLLGEGVEVVRPVYGKVLGKNIYRILPIDNYDPSDEAWEFLPNTVVRCERKINSDGLDILLAIEAVQL